MHKRKSVYEIDQPFDLFEGFEESAPPMKFAPPKRIRPRRSWMWVAALFLGLVVSGFVGLGWLQRGQEQFPYVFIEVRTISPRGRAVTGAQVFLDGNLVGVSDSFGEWRRYLRLKPGRELQVEVRKSTRSGDYRAAKVLRIPYHQSSKNEKESELRINLKLQAASRTSAVQRNTSDEQSSSSARARRKTREPQETVKSRSKSQGLQSIPGSYLSENHLQSIDVRFRPFSRQHGSLMETHQAGVLKNKVLPEVIVQATETNLNVSSKANWHLYLTYIPQRDNVGLIKGELHWVDEQGRQHQSSFLTHFAKTIEETASNLLHHAKSHTRKLYGAYQVGQEWYVVDSSTRFWQLRPEVILRDPEGHRLRLEPASVGAQTKVWRLSAVDSQARICRVAESGRECSLRSEDLRDAPPSTGWSVQKMRLNGALPQNAELYLSGYRAYPSRNGVWLFWGLDQDRMRLTIIANDRIYLRQWVTIDRNQPPTIRLPSLQVSRRQVAHPDLNDRHAY